MTNASWSAGLVLGHRLFDRMECDECVHIGIVGCGHAALHLWLLGRQWWADRPPSRSLQVFKCWSSGHGLILLSVKCLVIYRLLGWAALYRPSSVKLRCLFKVCRPLQHACGDAQAWLLSAGRGQRQRRLNRIDGR